MASVYVKNLIMKVVDNSEASAWEDAVKEWEISDCEEDETATERCICGKENIRYLFTIRNIYNGNKLYPIGSTCIKKFEREELKEEVNIYEGMFRLLHAVENGAFLSLSPELFSRKILKALYDKGAFRPTEYNGYNGKEDYKFLLDMFNKRNKDSITQKQRKKITAILLNSIKPYLEQQLNDKVKK